MHDPTFSHFECFRGLVPPGFRPNFLGVMERAIFTTGLTHEIPDLGFVQTDYPEIHRNSGHNTLGELFSPAEEYFEWIDLLEAVLEAREQFTMVELGAGYGRWLANAAAAARQRGDLTIKLIGVEAEPTHFEWMKQHLADNGIDPGQHQLIEAAVDEREHTVSFYVGQPDSWYGQSIADPQHPTQGIATREVETITLGRILEGMEYVDLLDVDVQGMELVVLTSAIEELNRKVRRIRIGTHSPDIEEGLRELFWRHGWYKRNDYAVGSSACTEWGQITFVDGVQTWINQRLSPVPPMLVELRRLQAAMQVVDGRYGRLREEARNLRVDFEASTAEAREIAGELARVQQALESSLECVSSGYDPASSVCTPPSEMVDAELGSAVVRPPQAPWAYGALFALRRPPTDGVDGLLRVALQVLQGEVGVGLFNSTETDFSYRRWLKHSEEVYVLHIPIGNVGSAGRLVVQNGATDDLSLANVMSMKVFRVGEPLSDAARVRDS